MEPKVCVYILIVLLNLVENVISGCNYRTDSSYGYMCDFTFYSPNGQNNFTDISGGHAWFKGDGNVQRVATVSGSYSINIPAIICNKFYNNIWIVLKSIGIKTVDDYSFRNCKNLQYVDLNNNKITDVNKNSFVNNLELKTLFLNDNQLTTLPENVFSKLQKLTTLKLYSNNLTNLSQNIFSATRALKELRLEHNQIETLPMYIFAPLVNLQTLTISYNKISNLLPEWFTTLENLLELDLDRNQIEELPKNVFIQLKKLTMISLSYNKLTIIHANSFGTLPSLTYIHLSSNKIDGFYEKIIDSVSKLNTLSMAGNVCVNKYIYDNSTLKESMRASMEKCFETYELTVFGCISGNLDARVCKLEGENEKTILTFQEFENKTQAVASVADHSTKEIESLKSDHMELSSEMVKFGDDQKELHKNVTSLEAKQKELGDNFEAQMETLLAENTTRNVQSAENQSEIDKLNALINELQLFVKNQSMGYEELHNQVFELMSRPCECR